MEDETQLKGNLEDIKLSLNHLGIKLDEIIEVLKQIKENGGCYT